MQYINDKYKILTRVFMDFLSNPLLLLSVLSSAGALWTTSR